ncbi:hypothetical protein BH23PLA1_BH23PLA1_25250 [soil metagenome]
MNSTTSLDPSTVTDSDDVVRGTGDPIAETQQIIKGTAATDLVGMLETNHRCPFRAIAEFTNDWEDWIDLEGRLRWVNPTVERLTGYTVADCLVMEDYPLPIIHEADRRYMARHFQNAMASASGYDVEFRICRKDGLEAWMSAAWQSLVDKNGALLGYRTSIREISDRKIVELALNDAWANMEERVRERTAELAEANAALQAEIEQRRVVEQQLRENRQHYALAVQGSTDGLWDWDFVTGIIHYSPRFKELLGFENHEFGNDIDAFDARLHPEDLDRAQVAVRNHLKHHVPFDIEYRVLTKSAEYRWFRARGRAVWDASGRATRMAGSIMDIQDRKQAENERDRFFSMSLDLLCVGGFDGYPRRLNPSFERVLGYSTEELLTRPYMELVHPDDHVATVVELKRLGRGETVSDFEHRIVCKDGSVCWLSWSASPVVEEGVFYGVARDVTDRRSTREQIEALNLTLERRLGRVAALRRIDRAITAGFDLRLTMEIVLDQVIEQLGVDAADLLLIDPDSGNLAHFASKGLCSEALRRFVVRPEVGVCGQVLQRRLPIHVPDLDETELVFVRAEALAAEGFRAYSAVPLVAKGQVKGLLEVFHRVPLDVNAEWLDFLEALAGQAAVGLDNITLFEDLQRSHHELTVAYNATIEGWSLVLEHRDRETNGHSQRVTEMTVRLAQALGIDGEALVHIRRGALLHDIGKLSIPDSILLKPGPLTDEEWQIMKRHPQIAFDLLGAIPFLRPALDIPYGHHEHWDGQGYPRCLKGEQIPLSARIFAAVDIWDALSHDRPYRNAWPADRVQEHLRSLSGTHLDPEIVPVFLHLLNQESTRVCQTSRREERDPICASSALATIQATEIRAAAVAIRSEAAAIRS